MAVIAYTSAAVNPLVSQSDKVVEMSVTPLPVTAQLYGAGKEDGDPGAVWTYAWEIIDKPTGSLVRFQDTLGQTSALQNPVLENVDTWGNILVFLVVTNTNTGNHSSNDYLTKDTVKAKVVVRVKSTSASIQKFAKHEWSWQAHVNVWADVIETLKSTAVAIPAALMQLISGGYSEHPPGTVLHKHYGEDIDVGTTTARGALAVSDTPADPANPVALNVDYQPQSVQVYGTPTTSGWVHGIEVADTLVGGGNYPHALFPVLTSCKLKRLTFSFADFGDSTNEYAFEVYYGSAAQWTSGAGLTSLAAFDTSMGPIVWENAVHVVNSALSSVTLSPGHIVGVVVRTAPTGITGAKVGQALSITAHFYREV